MPTRPQSSHPGQPAVASARRHPLSILDTVLGFGLAWAAIVAVTSYVLAVGWPQAWRPVGVPILTTVTAAYAIVVARAWVRVRTSRYTVTAERVDMAWGRWRFYVGVTTHDKITDLHVHQSWLGRLRAYGTIRVETAGDGLALAGVEDPMAFKAAIERARDAYVRTLLGERPRAGRAPEPLPEQDAAVWEGRPSPAYFIGHVVGASFLVLAGVALLVASAGRGGFLGPGLGLLAFGLLTGSNAWVQYRHTRYTVLAAGVVVTSGWLARRRIETTYDKVTDVATVQSLAGRLLDYGQITINTAGGASAPVVFRGLADPERVKLVVDDARKAWRRRRE